MEDLFEEWLDKKDLDIVKRALTDKSYKNIDHDLEDIDTNYESRSNRKIA